MHIINQYINGGQIRKVYAKLGLRTTTSRKKNTYYPTI